MKFSLILVVLVIGAAGYFAMGGGAPFGLAGSDQRPELAEPPNATFLGQERQNPYIAEPASTEPA
jgi:hypothetical protein